MITKRVRACVAILIINFSFALPGISQIFKTPQVLYPSGGSTAQSVVVADVNKDGKADVIVANSGSRTGPSVTGRGKSRTATDFAGKRID